MSTLPGKCAQEALLVGTLFETSELALSTGFSSASSDPSQVARLGGRCTLSRLVTSRKLAVLASVLLFFFNPTVPLASCDPGGGFAAGGTPVPAPVPQQLPQPPLS